MCKKKFKMFSNMLNSIPVVGHAKGVFHYMLGDTLEGNKAMFEATRSTSVVAGGVVGAMAGPGGAIAGATAAGVLVDGLTSVANATPHGIIAGIDNIATDISNGEVPIGSVLDTTLRVGSDMLCGIGGGQIASSIVESVAENAAKSMVKDVTKDVVIAIGKDVVKGVVKAEAKNKLLLAGGAYTRDQLTKNDHLQPYSRRAGSSKRSYSEIPRNERSDSNTSKSSKNTSDGEKSNSDKDTTSGTGSQQPPDENNPRKEKQVPALTHWEAFFLIFNVKSLQDIKMSKYRKYIFKDLSFGQEGSLKALIRKLRKNDLLEIVVKLIDALFDKLDENEVTFQNFLSLAEFVATYIGEYMAEVNQNCSLTTDFDRRRQDILDKIRECINTTADKIYEVFQGLRNEIKKFTCEPYFRNIVSAVSHYYKHRVLPHLGFSLMESTYFMLIKHLLSRLKTYPESGELTAIPPIRREVEFEIYFDAYQRRVRIVVKVQDGNLELSSCYVLDVTFDGDKEGDEFVNKKKREKK